MGSTKRVSRRKRILSGHRTTRGSRRFLDESWSVTPSRNRLCGNGKISARAQRCALGSANLLSLLSLGRVVALIRHKPCYSVEPMQVNSPLRSLKRKMARLRRRLLWPTFVRVFHERKISVYISGESDRITLAPCILIIANVERLATKRSWNYLSTCVPN